MIQGFPKLSSLGTAFSPHPGVFTAGASLDEPILRLGPLPGTPSCPLCLHSPARGSSVLPGSSCTPLTTRSAFVERSVTGYPALPPKCRRCSLRHTQRTNIRKATRRHLCQGNVWRNKRSGTANVPTGHNPAPICKTAGRPGGIPTWWGSTSPAFSCSGYSPS